MQVYKVLTLLFLLMSLSLSAAENTGASYSFPKEYKHLPLKDQIKRYRGIYSGESDSPSVQLIHKAELFPILENGIALAYTFISEDQIYIQRYNSNIKEKSFEQLDHIWKRALEFLSKEQFSNKILNDCLICVANLISSYKQEVIKFHWDIDTVENEISEENNVGLVFAIFANPNPQVPNRRLAIDHFVDQLCHEKLSANLAFFDIHSNSVDERQYKKKFVHFGRFEGTSKMYFHDFAHSFLITKKAFPLKSKKMRMLYRFMLHLKDQKRWNDAMILRNGIFLIAHELIEGEDVPLLNPLHRDHNPNVFDFKVLVSQIETLFSKLTLCDWQSPWNVGTVEYKARRRDWEFVLKSSHDQNGDNFLPLIEFQVEGEVLKRPFPLAEKQDESWTLVENQEQVLDLKFCSKKEQRFADFSVHVERRDRLASALQDGYFRFWRCFLDLALQAEAFDSGNEGGNVSL